MKRSICTVSFLATILLVFGGLSQAGEGQDEASGDLVAALSTADANAPTDAPAEDVVADVNDPNAAAEAEPVAPDKPKKEPTLVRIDSVMPEQVEIDKPFTYTITLTSITASKVTNVVLTENLAPNFRFEQASPEPVRRGNQLMWEFDEIWPKATRKITITGAATSTQPIEHHTTIVTNLDETSAMTVVVEPKLELMLAELPERVSMGEVITAKFTVSNPGTGIVEGVKVSAELPEGLTTVDGQAMLSFDANNLDADQSREFTAELMSTAAGTYAFKATATSVSGLEAETMEVSTTVLQPVITLAKTGPDAQYVGRPVTFEMTVTNVGEVPAQETTIEEALPGAINSIKATEGAKMSGGQKLVWPLGTLDPGDSRTVKVSYIATLDGILKSNSIATAKFAEAVTASAETTLSGIPGILLEVIDIEDPIQVGERCTYVITVQNQGSAVATNVNVICEIEKAVKYVYSTGATVGKEKGNSIRFAPLPALQPKAKAVWRVVVTAEKPGDSLFKVTMTTDEIGRTVGETEATRIYE